MSLRMPTDTTSYVVIDVDPESYPKELRWIATLGAHVKFTKAGREEQTGVIVGFGRERRSDRYFKDRVRRALVAGREISDSDYECLIDSEGPLIAIDGTDDIEWFPGQASGILAYVPVPATPDADVVVKVYQPDPNGDGKRSLQDRLAIPLEIERWWTIVEVCNSAAPAGSFIDETSAIISETLSSYGWRH